VLGTLKGKDNLADMPHNEEYCYGHFVKYVIIWNSHWLDSMPEFWAKDDGYLQDPYFT
jgi:hypothetical protein